eukprot:7321824-Prorocentrum_lima.AAC.1
MIEKTGIDVTKSIAPINMWLKRPRDSQEINPKTKSKRIQHTTKQLKREAELVPFEDSVRKITLLD